MPMSTSTKLDKDEDGKPINEKMYRDLNYICQLDDQADFPSDDHMVDRLETRNYLDLGYVILREMGFILQNNHKALPYGALRTKLFLSAKVMIKGEQTLQNDPGPIKDYTFIKEHISDDEEGNRQVNNEQQQEDIAGQQGMHLAQPKVGGDFSQQIFARFDALQASQNQMLAEFQTFAISQNSQFDRVEHRMDHIDNAQQHYLSHYHQQYPDFKPYPPYHPPLPPQRYPILLPQAFVDDVLRGRRSWFYFMHLLVVRL
ncbi:hypothetical protein RHSIM_Rhsim02G0182800 [Rhododendron simsii]|uniref:Uncharacterized protein n=1 Tax=Rhododendron simsii TaxID=118357 RepID=A0A834HEM7_RHOSS|nr:hypothetical protein RHSIM_Rhsim02G0182800 [Rhododendron simsii]